MVSYYTQHIQYEGHQGEDSIELAFSSTESIIAARRFSEFIAEAASHPIAHVLLHVVHERGSKKDNAALALEGLGDWKR